MTHKISQVKIISFSFTNINLKPRREKNKHTKTTQNIWAIEMEKDDYVSLFCLGLNV